MLDQPGWASGEDDHVVARAEYDLEAEANNELSFKAGAMLNLAPKGMVCLDVITVQCWYIGFTQCSLYW